MLKKLPVRIRLSVAHAIWMAILFTALGFGTYNLVRYNLLNTVDAALLSSAQSIKEARFALQTDLSPLSLFLKSFFRSPVSVNHIMGERIVRPYAQLIDVSGKIRSKTENLRVSLPVTPKAVAQAEKGLATYETFKLTGSPALRQVTLPVMQRGKFTGELIQVGTNLGEVITSLHKIVLVLFFSLSLGLLLSVLFGYMLARSALRPVIDISEAASRLEINDLSVRLPLSEANDELRMLSVTFNRMFDHLEDAVNRLRRFTGDASHELRTPLAVIRGEVELTLMRERTKEEYKEALSKVSCEAIHMTDIVEELLLLARAESKSVALKSERIQVESFVKDIRHQVKGAFDKAGVKLKTDIRTSFSFTASYNFIALALINLLTNAVKHSHEGGVVELTASLDEKNYYFEVKDFGSGISAKDQPYIFDSFYRADNARNRSKGGFGIGLSLASALVKLHGGSISLVSEEGKGSTFKISIPLKKNKKEEPAIQNVKGQITPVIAT